MVTIRVTPISRIASISVINGGRRGEGRERGERCIMKWRGERVNLIDFVVEFEIDSRRRSACSELLFTGRLVVEVVRVFGEARGA